MGQTMTTLTEQESGWINDVATRLRLIQADTAQLEPEQRCEFLQEEVERAFKDVLPANRQRLLEALLVRFPVAGKTVGTFFDAPTAPLVATSVAESPEKTLERLLAALPRLADDQRAALVQKLSESFW
jgi:hypothetical protein